MASGGKLAVAAGLAAVGVGTAVYSAWSLQRRPTTPPRTAMMGGPGGPGGPRAERRALPVGGGEDGNSIQVSFGPEAAARLGITEEELNAKAKDLLAKGVRPEDLGRELGLGDAPLRVESRLEGGPGGPSRGPGPEIDPAWEGPFEFVRADSAVSAAKLESILDVSLEEAGKRGVDGVDTARGDPRDIARAARMALVPPAQGKAPFAEAVKALGGRVADDGSLTGSVVGIADILEGAQLDPTKVSVKGVEPDEEGSMPMPRRASEPSEGGGFRMMMRISMTQDDAGGAGELATMSMPVGDVWPDTADEVDDGEIAVEARCPVRLKNLDAQDGQAEIGVVMVRERGGRVWQPVRYNLYVRDAKAARGFAKAMQDARRAREGG